MKGGFVHNEVLVAPLARAFERADWNVDFEVRVRLTDGVGFIDLVAERDGYCIAVEAECSAKRIERDLEKGRSIGAHELWIVVPTRRVAGAVLRKLAQSVGHGDRSLFVLTQPQARQRVTNCLPLFAGA